MKCFAILLAECFRHAYFRAMLTYFQKRAYYRENTIFEIKYYLEEKNLKEILRT